MDDTHDSQSSHTYRDYVVEYSQTEECSMWKGKPLLDSLSYKIFGEYNMVSLITDEIENETCTEVHTLDMQCIDEYIMEPLFVVPDECKYTESRLLQYANVPLDSFLVSPSTRGEKHLAFKLKNCVICYNGNNVDVYIPRRVVYKTMVDTGHQGVMCTAKGSAPTIPFHKAKLLPHARKSAQKRFSDGRKHQVTTDHMPMRKDRYDKYVLGDAVVYIVISPQRRTILSEHGNDRTMIHKSRNIDIVCTAIVDE